MQWTPLGNTIDSVVQGPKPYPQGQTTDDITGAGNGAAIDQLRREVLVCNTGGHAGWWGGFNGRLVLKENSGPYWERMTSWLPSFKDDLAWITSSTSWDAGVYPNAPFPTNPLALEEFTMKQCVDYGGGLPLTDSERTTWIGPDGTKYDRFDWPCTFVDGVSAGQRVREWKPWNTPDVNSIMERPRAVHTCYSMHYSNGKVWYPTQSGSNNGSGRGSRVPHSFDADFVRNYIAANNAPYPEGYGNKIPWKYYPTVPTGQNFPTTFNTSAIDTGTGRIWVQLANTTKFFRLGTVGAEEGVNQVYTNPIAPLNRFLNAPSCVCPDAGRRMWVVIPTLTNVNVSPDSIVVYDLDAIESGAPLTGGTLPTDPISSVMVTGLGALPWARLRTAVEARKGYGMIWYAPDKEFWLFNCDESPRDTVANTTTIFRLIPPLNADGSWNRNGAWSVGTMVVSGIPAICSTGSGGINGSSFTRFNIINDMGNGEALLISQGNVLTQTYFMRVPVATPQYTYLDDANPYPSLVPNDPALLQLNHNYPRTSQHEAISTVSPLTIATYNHANIRGSSWASMAEPAFADDPNLFITRHICLNEFQGFTQSDQGYISAGPGFGGTGPITQLGPDVASGGPGTDVYAGHWLYKAGTTINQVGGITAGATTVTVANGALLQAGQYAVIYNAPFGSFVNAEHVLINTVVGNTVTFTTRGYKSTAASHADGSIIAQHALGGGTDPKLWAFNITTQCPVDGAGNRYCDYVPTWLATYYNKRQNNIGTTANMIKGISFDTDIYRYVYDACDANNDGVTDNGRSGATNWHGDGWDIIYSTLRALRPELHLVSGVHDARGFAHFNGHQLENAWDYGNGDFKYPPTFGQLPSMWALYLYNASERAKGPTFVQVLTKTASALYPGNDSGATPNTNKYHRMGLALCLMDCGYYATHSQKVGDGWWDEFAVDVVPGSINFGKAVNPTDLAARKTHRNWLGKPLGKFKRIYDLAVFDKANSLMPNGEFATDLTNWVGFSLNITRDPAGFLKASTMTTYQGQPVGAYVRNTTAIALANDQEYTLCFSAKASAHREVTVQFGSHPNQRFPVGPNWRKYVMTWKQSGASTPRCHWGLGGENTEFWLDNVYLFAGNANVFRRDFEKGIAIANATPNPVTVQLGGTFRLINGTQDPTVNNGAQVTSVTLDAWDGRILIR
jgi:hypothetical protein